MSKTDEDKGPRGGARTGAGRKSKRDEDQINNIFNAAIKRIYADRSDEEIADPETVDEDEARIEIIKDLFTFTRGKMFIAEHLFGKPKEVAEINLNNNGPDLSNMTTEQIKAAIDKIKPGKG